MGSITNGISNALGQVAGFDAPNALGVRNNYNAQMAPGTTEQLAAAHGITVVEPKSLSELSTAMQGSGTAVILLKTNRENNVSIHEQLHTAIASSVDAITNA
jgi:hypothetical protein